MGGSASKSNSTSRTDPIWAFGEDRQLGMRDELFDPFMDVAKSEDFWQVGLGENQMSRMFSQGAGGIDSRHDAMAEQIRNKFDMRGLGSGSGMELGEDIGLAGQAMGALGDLSFSINQLDEEEKDRDTNRIFDAIRQMMTPVATVASSESVSREGGGGVGNKG